MHKSSKAAQIEELFQEYLKFRQTMDHEDALSQFDYLHKITFSRLKKHVVDNYVGNVEKPEAAS